MSDAGRDDGSLRAMVLVAYGLFALAPFNGATALAGVILAYLKRDEARGTPWEGHMRNLIRVFWIAVVFAVVLTGIVIESFGGLFFSLVSTNGNPPPALVGGLVLLVPALWLGCLVFAIWYLYRVLRGLIRALEDKPY
jgi:uncharacterized membrane protein